MFIRNHAAVLAAAAALLAPRQAESQQSRARADSAIVAVERRGLDAVKRKDTRALFEATGGPFLYVQSTGIHRLSLATAPNAFAACETRRNSMDSVTVTPVSATAAVLTYRLTLDQTCGGQKIPMDWYETAVYEHRDGRWILVTRSDTRIEQPLTR